MIIHAGRAPIKLNPNARNMERLLLFALRFSGWHSYRNNRATRQALAALAKMQVIEWSPSTEQYRFHDTRPT